MGEELILPDTSATDSLDNDLTDDIEITNNVDENIPGTYTVVYTVTDNNNNATTRTITVIVEDIFGTITDSRDGEIYATVKIGDQTWLAENLRYTGNSCLSNTWNSTVPYNACMEYSADWGIEVRYQWGAAMNGSTTEGSQGICPDDWYLPTDEDWKILEGTVDTNNNVGDSVWDNTGWRGDDVGIKLRAIAAGGTDDYGFGALLAGYITASGTSLNVGANGNWWSSSPSSSNVWGYFINLGYDGVHRASYGQANGFSVRCILTQ